MKIKDLENIFQKNVGDIENFCTFAAANLG